MKKLKYLLLPFLALAGFSNGILAQHHHVSNVPGVTADFTTIQAAHDAGTVSSGDTIYLEPSPYSYGDLTWTKKLIIIGNGFFLAANPETQASTSTSKINSIVILDNSDFSRIMGCEISSITFTKKSESIHVGRNLIGSISCTEPNPDSAYHYNFIYANYINSLNCGNHQNLYVENNYIVSLTSGNAGNRTIRNNVINGTLNVFNADVRNNIISGTNVNVQGSSAIYNNVCSGSPFGTTNGNQANVNMEDVFVCWSSCNAYSPDGRFQLKPGSPAENAGYGGTDCGFFGGDHPYVLSGIPAVPAIYYINTAPQGETMSVRVKVKVRD